MLDLLYYKEKKAWKGDKEFMKDKPPILERVARKVLMRRQHLRCW
jgi:hypothetical protein